MLSPPRRPLLDSSLAALVLVNARHRATEPPTARTASLAPRIKGGNATAMSIQFAPEPEPTANIVDLGEDQTTGPVPLGFEFEFFGVGYTWFDLSSDGFMRFGTNPFPNFIALGWTDVGPLGRRRVAYEVRGAAQRRRLVLSFTLVPPSPAKGLGTMTAQLVLHERTGMIDVHTTRQEPVGYRVSQKGVRFTTAPSWMRLRPA